MLYKATAAVGRKPDDKIRIAQYRDVRVVRCQNELISGDPVAQALNQCVSDEGVIEVVLGLVDNQ